MSYRYIVPEPGNKIICVTDIESAIEEYEATEENEQGEFEVPFDPELYIALKDLWSEVDGYRAEEMILESYFVEYITDLIDDAYSEGMPDKKVRGQWPYRHMKMDYEAAAEEAKEDYTEVTFGGYTYYVR